MCHITEQRSPAATTEPGHGTDHHTRAAQPQPLHGLEALPHTRPLSLAVINWEGGDTWCPAEKHHTLPRSLLQGTFHCHHSATVPFPISCLYAASVCFKIQHRFTTLPQRTVPSTDEADACLSNLSPSPGIPTGLHSELAKIQL